MRVVEPVDFLHEFGCLRSETDWGDVEVFETLVGGVHDERLTLDSHELGVQPGAEQLSVEGLEPLVVVVLVCHLQWDS